MFSSVQIGGKEPNNQEHRPENHNQDDIRLSDLSGEKGRTDEKRDEDFASFVPTFRRICCQNGFD